MLRMTKMVIWIGSKCQADNTSLVHRFPKSPEFACLFIVTGLYKHI
jgi:hypothetical protein